MLRFARVAAHHRRVRPPVVSVRVQCFSIDKGSFVTENLHYIKMPSVMESKEGTIDKWLKKEGESFKAGESICEISTTDFSLAVDHEIGGIIAEIIAGNGKTIEADHPIASFVTSKEEYLDYVEQKREKVMEQEHMENLKELHEEKTRKPDNMTLMREIKHLIQSGAIKEDSEFAKAVQSLARKGNPELMAVFVASFDGTSYNDDTFDSKFFISNAMEIVADLEKAQKV